jgi:hypothetical protein
MPRPCHRGRAGNRAHPRWPVDSPREALLVRFAKAAGAGEMLNIHDLKAAYEKAKIPLKPGNAGGGKEPQFKTDAISGEGLEIGQPNNSEKCSETADGVTRESEG